MDEQQDAASENYSPLVYAPLTYEEYLKEGEHAEVGEPELQAYEEDPKEEWEEVEGTEPSESCLTAESRTSSVGYEPYLTCSLCAQKAATHGDLCHAC